MHNAAVPNNAVLVARNYNSYFYFYCQSNSTSNSVGSFTGDYSSYFSQSYCGAGCYQLYTSSYWYSSYQGVYTCTIPNSNGTYLDVNVGLYPYGFNCKYDYYYVNGRINYYFFHFLHSSSKCDVLPAHLLHHSLHPVLLFHRFPCNKCHMGEGRHQSHHRWNALPTHTDCDIQEILQIHQYTHIYRFLG